VSVTLEIIESGIARLQVNRPGVRNALNWQAMADLADCIEQAHQDPDLRVLIVSGAGNNFIAGGDLKELHRHASRADGERLADLMGTALNRLEALPCPTIAALNGPARGGGVEIALACDLRVMAADASLGLVQISLGLSPGWGAGGRLLRLVGYSRALELLATGQVLDAEQAARSGLANLVTPPGAAIEGALELARKVCAQPAAAVLAIKRLLRTWTLLPPGAAASQERAEFPPLWAADDHIQAVERFLAGKTQRNRPTKGDDR
jgi:enoyl-CoA hydratase